METKVDTKPVGKSFCSNPRVLIMSVGAAALIIVAALLSTRFPRGSWQRIGLAVVQGVTTAAVVLISVRSMRRLDEMQQRIQLEALALAFFGTGVLGATYGFLEGAGLPLIDWGASIWPVMIGLWALGVLIASRRYR
jgi:hypothetical protein